MTSRRQILAAAGLTMVIGIGQGAKARRRSGPPNLATMGQRYADAIVSVERGVDGNRLRKTTGFFVSGSGHILTVSSVLDVDDVVTIELQRGDRLPAVVVATSSMGVVALQLSDATAAAGRWTFLRMAETKRQMFPRGWFVSMGHSTNGGHVLAAAGEFAAGGRDAWMADIPASVGAPILSKEGKVVGLVDKRVNAARTRVRPAALVLPLLQSLAAN